MNDLYFLKKEFNRVLKNEFYFNKVSPDLEVGIGNMYYCAQYNPSINGLLDYCYETSELVEIEISKNIGLVALSRFMENIDNAKPLIAAFLLELKALVGVAHYEPHIGKYMEITDIVEMPDSAGYTITIKSLAIPFDKTLCKIKSLHD